MVLLRALWFLPIIPLPDGGIPPLNGKGMRIAIKIEIVTEIDVKKPLYSAFLNLRKIAQIFDAHSSLFT